MTHVPSMQSYTQSDTMARSFTWLGWVLKCLLRHLLLLLLLLPPHSCQTQLQRLLLQQPQHPVELQQQQLGTLSPSRSYCNLSLLVR
jgi:hypothetical protein